MPSFLKSGFEGISHRGDTSCFTENTMEAFVDAYKLGFRYFETDVRLSKDHKVILAHDATLKRIADSDRSIKELTCHQLKKMSLIRGGTLTLLEDALAAFPDVVFNIDLKEPNTMMPTLQVLDQMNAYHRVCVASFNSHTLQKVRHLRPHCITSMGMKDVFLLKFFSLVPRGSHIVQISEKWHGLTILTPRLIDFCHHRKLKIHVFDVNDQRKMAKLIELGVDGIMTDNLAGLKEVMLSYNLMQDEST